MINFRDLGNVKNKDGKTVIPNHLFRSGELCGLSQQDKTYLEEDVRLKMIVDFRSAKERTESPDDTLANADYVPIDIMKDSKGNTASLDDVLKGLGSAEKRMENIYEELITTPSALEGYRQFLELLVEKANLPLIFHCFAGKDRTGVGAALILKMLDVPQEAILTDYLKTNTARKEANDEIINQMVATYQVFNRDDVETLLTVQPNFLAHAQQLMRENYGSFEGYVKNGLHLPADFSKEMKQLYLI